MGGVLPTLHRRRCATLVGENSERSALGELLDVDYEAIRPEQLYRASDVLFKHRSVIETSLFNRISELFGLGTTVTLYDLTNTYFEGEVPGNGKARRGHSKEKRSDCPLLTLALMLDGSGFVRRSEVFEGNAVEAQTLEGMLAGLAAPQGSLVVMDRGIASEANLQWLADHGYRYLVVSRERHRQFDPRQALTIETASAQSISLQKVLSEDGKEVRLYCYSEQRAENENGIERRFAKRFETELQKLHDGLSRPRTHKQIDKLWERIGRLKEKSRGAAQHYHIEIVPDESGTKAAMRSAGSTSPGPARVKRIRVSTACAATSWAGTRSRCGVATPCSPIWRRCSAHSNPSWVCVRSITTRPAAVMPICSSPCWPTNSYRSSANACKRTALPSDGIACASAWPANVG